jgi:hypothetical protein
VKQYVDLQVFRDFKKVRFYTFKLENETESETTKFFNRLKNVEIVTQDLNRLATWIVEIGQNHGAFLELFRFEDEAYALPPPPKGQRMVGLSHIENNDLRLYCVWISESIVILANGGIKKSMKVQDTPELMPHFRFAKSMGRQINQLITEGTFKYKGKEILESDDLNLLI